NEVERRTRRSTAGSHILDFFSNEECSEPGHRSNKFFFHESVPETPAIVPTHSINIRHMQNFKATKVGRVVDA
ncbi:hypothetical protein OS493_040448, partial [Desmophyllum pertusum]